MRRTCRGTGSPRHLRNTERQVPGETRAPPWPLRGGAEKKEKIKKPKVCYLYFGPSSRSHIVPIRSAGTGNHKNFIRQSIDTGYMTDNPYKYYFIGFFTKTSGKCRREFQAGDFGFGWGNFFGGSGKFPACLLRWTGKNGRILSGGNKKCPEYSAINSPSRR